MSEASQTYPVPGVKMQQQQKLQSSKKRSSANLALAANSVPGQHIVIMTNLSELPSVGSKLISGGLTPKLKAQ